MSPAWRLQVTMQREHILVAIAACQERWREFGELIADAADVADARQRLMSAFALDEVQATAALDMQFRRLAGVDRLRITEELTEIRREMAQLRDQIAADPDAAGRRPQEPPTDGHEGWWGYQPRE